MDTITNQLPDFDIAEQDAEQIGNLVGEISILDKYNEHNNLLNRDAENAHPISAITGLSEAIDDVAGHIRNENIHVTDDQKDAWNSKYSKPDDGIPRSDLSEEVLESLEKADSALQEVPSTYRTSAEQDVIDAGKQPVISDLDAIRSGSALGATAVQPEEGKGLFSGDYNDLTNKPDFPGEISYLTTAVTKHVTPLPTGYTQIEYIETVGTGTTSGQAIVGGSSPANQDTRVVLKFALTDMVNENHIFGSRQSTTSNAFYGSSYGDGTWGFGYGSSGDTVVALENDFLPHTIDFNKKVVSFDGRVIVIFPLGAETFTCPSAIRVGAIRSSSSSYYFGSIRIYRYTEYSDGVLVNDKFPAIRDSDGAIGMYDVVTRRFYTNEKDGELEAGPILSVENNAFQAAYASAAVSNKYTKPAGGIPESDIAAGVISRYTVTTASSPTATLALNDTTILPGTPTAVSVTLPTPVSGKDYIVGLIFKAGASMTFSDAAPTGHAIKWASNPTWTEGKVYEICYRCLWLTDGNGDVIISAKWGEV